MKRVNGIVGNDYEFKDDYVIGYEKSNHDNYFYIDLDDYERVSRYTWNLDKKSKYWHATARIGDVIYGKTLIKNKSIRLHRFIMNAYTLENKKYDVDHIETLNKFDNRKSNLRLVTKSQNIRNHKLAKNNNSGYVGVYWSKKDECWYSQLMSVQHKGKKYKQHLGCMPTKESAVRLRLLGELYFYGEEYSPQRHLFKRYGITKDLLKDYPNKTFRQIILDDDFDYTLLTM